MEEALNYFSNLQDPRSSRNQRHPLRTLIGVSLLASLGGIDSFSGFADFAEAHLDSLKTYFDFPHGVPSHDTFQRLWDGIDPNEFYQSFHHFTQHIINSQGDIISLDGKTIRHSGQEKALHIVSAWCRANQLTLAQEKVDSKSNEITALPQLIRLLDLKGRIVTIDAMGAQRDICSLIIERNGDYVIALKGNQGPLHKDVIDYFNAPALKNTCCSSEENDKGHGRVEQRVAYACEAIDWLDHEHQWPGLKSIGLVETRVERKGKVTQEKRYYISSLPTDAKRLNDAAKAHWGIENQLHWRLDVVFNEDGGYIRNDNAAGNRSALSKKQSLIKPLKVL